MPEPVDARKQDRAVRITYGAVLFGLYAAIGAIGIPAHAPWWVGTADGILLALFIIWCARS